MQRTADTALCRPEPGRGPIRFVGPCPLFLLTVAMGIVLFLAGCGPKWGAPVESRTPQPYSSTQKRPSHYQVRRGDTLAAIAWRWGLDWRVLSAWNGIRSPYTIHPGQRLRLVPPKRMARNRVPPPASRPPARPGSASTNSKAKPSSANRPVASPRVANPAASERFPRTLRWRWPTDGQVLSKYQAADEARKGIKIGGRKGRGIIAAEAGKVVYSGSGLIGYGRLIIIKHNNEFLSAYGHNRKLLVKEGDWVAKGDKIAEMGLANNGQAMLHFEIRRNGKPVNPAALLPRRAG